MLHAAAACGSRLGVQRANVGRQASGARAASPPVGGCSARWAPCRDGAEFCGSRCGYRMRQALAGCMGSCSKPCSDESAFRPAAWIRMQFPELPSWCRFAFAPNEDAKALALARLAAESDIVALGVKLRPHQSPAMSGGRFGVSPGKRPSAVRNVPMRERRGARGSWVYPQVAQGMGRGDGQAVRDRIGDGGGCADDAGTSFGPLSDIRRATGRGIGLCQASIEDCATGDLSARERPQRGFTRADKPSRGTTLNPDVTVHEGSRGPRPLFAFGLPANGGSDYYCGRVEVGFPKTRRSVISPARAIRVGLTIAAWSRRPPLLSFVSRTTISERPCRQGGVLYRSAQLPLGGLQRLIKRLSHQDRAACATATRPTS